MKKSRARAIIPYGNGLILIHRIREIDGLKRDYYVFPGGGIESGGTKEECVIREVYEELGINVRVDKKIYEITNKSNEIETLFLCEYISGRIGSGKALEFQIKERGLYIPIVIDFNQIKDIELLKGVKEALLCDLKTYDNINSIPFRRL
jgi:8-oxo-dGTP pyrophosphatase MutT (NUDIX family)